MFDFYIQMSRSLSKLLKPFIEIVIHDLSSKKIVFIIGSLSKRKKNDLSFIDDDFESKLVDIDQIIYTKLNFDGRLIKSLSIPIKKNEKIIGLWCFNFDVTFFQEFQDISKIVLDKNITKRPSVLFVNDWQDKINQFIYDYLKEQQLQFTTLTIKDKKHIIQKLYKQNAFTEKNAANYIAKTMNISRSTIFNYLREWKQYEYE